MNTIKYFWLLVLMLVGLKSKSQTLLNLNLSEINKEIVLHEGGILKTTDKKVKFSYPIPPEGNDCIFYTTCYFTSENKCFKYVNEYWGDELPYQEIDRLTKYYSNLKKVYNKTQWIDYKNGFRITLINDKDIHAAYSLKIENLKVRSHN